MAKKSTVRDAAGELLSEMIKDFSLKRAIAWLERKFPSFDTSKAQSLSVSENKNDKRFFSSARVLGFITELAESKNSNCNCPVLVAAIEMKNDLTERTSRQSQFNFARRALQEFVKSGSVGLNGVPSQGIFFFYDKDQYFRISLVSGKVEGRRFKFNEAKRQSFYINPERPNNVAKSRLQEPIRTYVDLKEAFSVETLTKEFYSRLFEWYEWAMKPRTGVTFPNNLDDDTDDKKYNNESIIRLITRLMFTWFIRQRGLVPEECFTIDGVSSLLKKFDPESMEQDNYYRTILQNLFFATLNCQPERRSFRKSTGNGSCKNDWGIKTLYRYEKEFSDAALFKKMMKKVPFLNCALFDCLDKQEREQDGGRTLLFDGFSDTKKRQAHVPNGLFFHAEKGIVKLFDTYEFTIDENNADDADVALDPELLGKVFENLLGAFNPETSETARKSTGSFYTPREIVDYMVEESLKNHLKTKVPALKDEWLDDLFDKAKAAEKTELPFGDGIAGEVRDALYTCKILDPACGSGAFPMGILHCMVRLFARLDPNNTDLNDRLIARYKTETKQATDPLFTESERAERLEALKVQLAEGQHYPDYARKLYLIENCIYGVDIQPIATQISKLRFFISLLCDQLRSNWNESIENHGLLSLPNLEAKFVCANTLISLPDTEGELGLSVSNISKLRERLQENRHRIFAARTYRQKDRLKAKDMEIRDQIRDAVRSTLAKPDKKLIAIQKEVIENLKRDRMRYEDAKMVKRSRPVQGSLFGELSQSELDYEMVDLNKPKRDEIDEQIRFAQRKIDAENAKSKSENVTAIDKLAHMVAGWDPYDQNATSAFFDPKWMFNIENGFDIVIGNPPYVQLQANGGELAKLYMDKGYETYCRNGDIYCLFYEYGMKVLVPGGVLNFITSDKWMVAQYGELMRDWVLSKTLPEKLIDFAGKRIFESATVETNILILKKADAKDGMILSCRFSAPIYSDLGMAISKGLSPCKFELGDKWFVKSAHELKIAEKVRLNGKPLKDWDIKVNFGIKTGLNSAFIIDNDTRNELVAKDRKSAEILKPIFRGRDIQKYWSKDVVWLIATFPSMGYDIDYFISIKKHLLSFDKRVLSQSGEKNIGGEKGRNARKKTSNKWFETQDQISFYDEFKKPKIFWKRIGSILRFTYSEDEVYGLDSTCIMTGEHIKYLLAVLNSKMGNYLLKDSPRTGTGDLLISVQAMEPIRVPSPSQVEELPIINLIDRIIAAKKEDPNADTSALEAEIDQLVYKLYGLTEEEIAIVEGNQAQRLRLARPGCAGQDLTQGMSQAGGSVVGAPSKIRRSVKVARPIEECDDEELE